MAVTYVAIASVSVPVGGQPTIDFQNIPQTYTDLSLSVSTREETAASATMVIEFNGTSSNRSERKLQGSGGNTSSNTTSDFQIISNPSNYTANVFGNCTIYIPRYAEANIKLIGSESCAENVSATDVVMRLTAGLWNDGAAINRITIKINPGSSGGDINQYSTATLYGIKNTV